MGASFSQILCLIKERIVVGVPRIGVIGLSTLAGAVAVVISLTTFTFTPGGFDLILVARLQQGYLLIQSLGFEKLGVRVIGLKLFRGF